MMCFHWHLCSSFVDQAMGESIIRTMLATICKASGIDSRTNHALRRTSITAMYNMNLPEHEIQRRTRHASLDGLRKYIA